jgi:thiamine monophosphate synthase
VIAVIRTSGDRKNDKPYHGSTITTELETDIPWVALGALGLNWVKTGEGEGIAKIAGIAKIWQFKVTLLPLIHSDQH